MGSWFNVDKEGLRKLVEDRPKVFVLWELIQNALDENSTRVEASVEMIAPGKARLVVTDDNPSGFADLSHAYTMFAPSKKLGRADLRGRFNAGEKYVLALCEEARISSTTGAVAFGRDGERQVCFDRTDAGSRFEGVLRLTKSELFEIEQSVGLLQPPANVNVTFNGRRLLAREPLATFESVLPTVLGDADGVLRRTTRKTTLTVFATAAGETAMLYELGIPVVETGDLYHVSIGQKIPLNTDRDNVPPSYLREVRAFVLNAMHGQIDAKAATETWVDMALESDRIDAEAVRDVVRKRFGERAVIADPSDPEATQRAVAEGYHVVHGGALSGAQWSAVKNAGALKPAGAVFPTPKVPTGAGELIAPADYTPGMRDVVALTERLGSLLVGRPIRAQIAKRLATTVAGCGALACYGACVVTFNLQGLGRAWFSLDGDHLADVVDLMLHEFGHSVSDNHLDAEYHRAVTRMAGRLVVLALREPALFEAQARDGAAA